MGNVAEDGFLRLRAIIGDRKRGELGLIPIAKSAWYDGIAKGIYPKPVRLSPRTSAWRASDIRELIDRLSRGETLKSPN